MTSRALPSFLGVILLASPVFAANDKEANELSLTLTANNVIGISADKDTTRAAFDQAYGQFQVLIPKQLFPVAAPHCRKNVILRMPGTAPHAPNAKAALDAKWDLFQSIHAVLDGRASGVKVFIDAGPYMTRDNYGRVVLEWCNAFFRN